MKRIDLKQANISQLDEMCREIRSEIIDAVKKRGGHLASNLGAVELTVALHRVFYFPKDKIVFDVGHQCYTHKLLSGRGLGAIRTRDGISGFPKRSESDYDAYDTGHAGTALSAALGLAKARDLAGEDFSVIALIGDGSFQNGLIYEALNSLSLLKTNVLILVNDNGMSISPTAGSVHEMLSVDLGGNDLSFYAQFGLQTMGVYDGNDLSQCISALTEAKGRLADGSVLVHFRTRKGKGYSFSENAPESTHGVSPEGGVEKQEYSVALGKELGRIMKEEESAVVVTAAMTDALGLRGVFEAFPERCFDVGICEEHAAVLSAALAVGGRKPYFAIYSTFLQRAYDEVIHDICGQDLPVTVCLDRSGISGTDGETHQGVFDLSYLSCIPNAVVAAPRDIAEFRSMLRASASFPHPFFIRYPREGRDLSRNVDFRFGKWEVLHSNMSDITILAVGERCVSLAEKVAARFSGNKVDVINARFVKPLDEEALNGIAGKHIITLEDQMLSGGFGSAVSAYYARTDKKIYSFGYRSFIPQGNVGDLMAEYGLNEDEIAACIGRIYEGG